MSEKSDEVDYEEITGTIDFQRPSGLADWGWVVSESTNGDLDKIVELTIEQLKEFYG